MRRAHLAEYRAWRDGLAAHFPWAFTKHIRWRSWRHHPISNSRHWWWTHVPHRPRWELEEATVGPVGHESRVDADMVMIADRCRRCGVLRHEQTFYPRTEDDDDGPKGRR